jgi:single-stranded-DNA-specific exonuclease
MPDTLIHRRQLQSDPDALEGVHPLLAQVYAARGVTSIDELDRGAASLLAPEQLSGIGEAVSLLVEGLKQQKSVLIVGDYDADGATSSALSVLALRAMGFQSVDYLVPNRFEFGYGLTPQIVDVAKARSPDILITVDNGISSIEGVAAAKQLGMTVIVTDHHLAGDSLPAADAIINPNQPGCSFPSKALAGVGVAFYLMTALRAELRRQGWFQAQGVAEPNMGSYLDLVALGTVADVVPLDKNNRILVHQGLERIRRGMARPGILALLKVANRRREGLVAADLGFAVGPRLNAAGRLDDMSLGVHCLLVDDVQSATDMASLLDEFNRDRRSIEQEMQESADRILRELHLNEGELPWGLCLYDTSWHQGVIGILASRIKERFHRPVIAFATDDRGAIKGSARSIPGFHIRDALDTIATRHPGLLTKFGGHAMAAGLSLAEDDFPVFCEAFDQQVRSVLLESNLRYLLLTDGELSADDFNISTAELLVGGGPWGQQFPEPVFEGVFDIVNQRLVGDSHLKMVVSPAGRRAVALDAIAFRVDTEVWPNLKVRQVKMVYRLDINEFRGNRNLQLVVENLSLIE